MLNSDEKYAIILVLSALSGIFVVFLQRFKYFSCGKCNLALTSARANNTPLVIPNILNNSPTITIDIPPPPPQLPPNTQPEESDFKSDVMQDIVLPVIGDIVRRLSHDIV